MTPPDCPHCLRPLRDTDGSRCPWCAGDLGSQPEKRAAGPTSRHRRKLLLGYDSYRRTPPTLGRLLVKWIPTFTFLVVILGGWAGLLFVYEWTELGWWTLGVLFGALLREWRWLLASSRAWPVLADIIDWRKLDRRLAETDPDAPAAE